MVASQPQLNSWEGNIGKEQQGEGRHWKKNRKGKKGKQRGRSRERVLEEGTRGIWQTAFAPLVNRGDNPANKQSHHSLHFTELELIQVFALYSDGFVAEQKHKLTVGYWTNLWEKNQWTWKILHLERDKRAGSSWESHCYSASLPVRFWILWTEINVSNLWSAIIIIPTVHSSLRNIIASLGNFCRFYIDLKIVNCLGR